MSKNNSADVRCWPSTLCTRARRLSARLLVLPLVSKRWARIMRTSTEAWTAVFLNLSEIAPYDHAEQHRNLDYTAMAIWFQARPGRVRELGLGSWSPRMWPSLPAAMTSMLLSTQAASMESLSIDARAYDLWGPGFCVVAALRRLMALDVHVDEDGLLDRGAGVLRTACRLPALSDLKICYEDNAGDGEPARHPEDVSLPRCQELAELRSRSLTELSLAMASDTDGVLRLTGLPSLRRCHLLLDGSKTIDFSIDSTSFKACTRLQQLSLHYQQHMTLQPGCFAALAAMTCLTLTDCGLTAVPSAVADLRSLRNLDLSENDNLCIDEAGMSVLRALKKLRSLDVAKCETTVQHHNGPSVQGMLEYVLELRDAGQRLHINFDTALSVTCQPNMGYWGYLH